MPIATEFQGVFQSLVAIIRTSSAIHAQDVGFFRTADKKLRTASEEESARLLDLINRVIEASTGETLDLASAKDIRSRWSRIESVFDTLFDHAENALSSTHSKSEAATPAPASPLVVHHDKTIEKPQAQFSTPVDNSYGPFKPSLTQKFHAKVGLEEATQQQPGGIGHEQPWYKQPYSYEIEHAAYPPFVNKITKAPAPPPLHDTKFNFVSTPKQLRKLVSKLSRASVVAVDLEHHDYRSYLGLVCLMQISTTSEDWIVDTLALRSELQSLNEIFCDPHILKVFHGAQRDILWLQRDLGIYVVSLFDTYHAARALGFPKCSLAYLLQTIADFTASKQYQLADWRVRPLTPELTDYARADTHFLIYIYETLKNRLIEAGKLEEVLVESRKTAGQRYEKPEYNSAPGWSNIALKNNLNPDQSDILRALFEWRDSQAREKDESPRYIMPNSFLVDLAISQPATASGVVSAAVHIPPYARSNAVQLATLIDKTLQSVGGSPQGGIKNVASNVPLGHATPVDVFSQNALDSVASLRKSDPVLFAPIKSRPSRVSLQNKVFLGVFKLDEVSKELGPIGAADAASAIEQPPPVNSSPSPTTSAKESPNRSGTLAKQKGKRKINVVTDAEDVHSPEPAKKRRSVEDAPAFDFGSANQVFKEDEKDETFKQFRNFSGPKGARNKRRGPKAMSKTFKHH